MVVDRTTEFFNIVESMRDDVQVNESASLLPSRDMKVDQNFHQIGKQVTSLIQTLHDTKLEDLRKLVKNMNMYVNNTPQIENLLVSIKDAMQKIANSVIGMEKVVESGTHSNQKHAESILKHVKTQLNGVGNDLSNLTSVYTKNLTRFNYKVKQYTSNSAASTAIFNPQELSEKLENGDLQQLIEAPQEQSSYFKGRLEEVKAMGRQIYELTSLFQQMSRLTAEQTEQIMRIDDNLTSVEENVDTGRAELLKYYKWVSSNRGMILKIFFILVVFVLFFVFFLA